MLSSMQKYLSVFFILNCFLFFYSPIFVISSIICMVLCIIVKQLVIKTNVEQKKVLLRSESIRVNTDRNTNIRVIKSAKRQFASQTRSPFDFSLMSKFNTNVNHNYLGRTESVFSSINNQTFGLNDYSSHNHLSYQSLLHKPKDELHYELPNSQLGRIPRVKLSPGLESSPLELNLKKKSVTKPVTVRIAPMPANISSKLNSNRFQNISSSTSSTLGLNDNQKERENNLQNTKNIIEALKLKRKRGQKSELETEESFKLSVKKAKHDSSQDSSSLSAPKVSNGLMPAFKQPVKRSSLGATQVTPKRAKNNEISSSYSSLQNSSIGQTIGSKTKRKLSPQTSDTIETKSKRTLVSDEDSVSEKSSSLNISKDRIENSSQIEESNDLLLNTSDAKKVEDNYQKKSYGLPLHLHSMEDHERDKNKARNRLSRLLNAIQEVKSPKSEQKPIEVLATDVTKTDANTTSEITLPSIPTAAIFTNSRVETVVTTTLLNTTPISSVSTTSRESISPQTQPVFSTDTNVDNCDNCSMTSAPNSPEVSTSVTTPLNFSLSSPMTSINTTENNSVKFDIKSIINNNAIKTLPSMPSTQMFGKTTNIFNSPPSTTSTFTMPSLVGGITSSSLQIPQFSAAISSSAPMPALNLNFSQTPVTFNSQPTFPTIVSNPNPTQLFSLGSASNSVVRKPPLRTRPRKR